MTAGQQVEALDECNIDARNVAEGVGDLRSLGSVDVQGPFPRDVPLIAYLPFARADGERLLRPLSVGVGADPLEGVDGAEVLSMDSAELETTRGSSGTVPRGGCGR